jgi:hypothetical protein
MAEKWPKPEDPEGRPYKPEGFPKLKNTHRLGKELPDLTKAGGRTRQTASRLKEIRLAAGMSQMSLAVHAQTTLEVVRKAERGYLLQLKTSTILRLANTLDCGVADIFPLFAERLNKI